MSIYTVEIAYNAKFIATVEANDEGEALHKAREVAEETDADEFILTEERDSKIISID